MKTQTKRKRIKAVVLSNNMKKYMAKKTAKNNDDKIIWRNRRIRTTAPDIIIWLDFFCYLLAMDVVIW